jgi:hypothetical protein
MGVHNEEMTAIGVQMEALVRFLSSMLESGKGPVRCSSSITSNNQRELSRAD